MTDEELAQIRAREAEATPGPWAVSYAVDGHIGLEGTVADAAFVTAARHEVPALLAEVERRRAENAEMREIAANLADYVQRTLDGYNSGDWDGLPDDPDAAQDTVTKARALLAAQQQQESR